MKELNNPNPIHLRIISVWLLLVWILSAINPFDRSDWLLENLLVFFFSILLITTYSRFRFSNTSYWLYALFMTLHLIGAHYTYAEAPIGFWFQDWFSLERNHYDRVVHFLFGLLLAWSFRELLTHYVTASRRWINALSLCIVLALSALYELVEMLAALVVAPDVGIAFLGTQGDVWDAQKDTGLAFTGAILAILVKR